MKVQGRALNAYMRSRPVEGPSVSKLQPDRPRDVAPPKVAGLGVEDFFSLSPKAQSGLVERMLMTSIGQRIGADFSAQGIELDQHVDEDHSPEAVSKRIVDFATGMFAAFEAQNPDLGESELLSRFEDTLRSAVDVGYGQANGVLDAMDKVDDEVKSVGATTMELVHAKFDTYFADRRSAQGAPQP